PYCCSSTEIIPHYRDALSRQSACRHKSIYSRYHFEYAATACSTCEVPYTYLSCRCSYWYCHFDNTCRKNGDGTCYTRAVELYIRCIGEICTDKCNACSYCSAGWYY